MDQVKLRVKGLSPFLMHNNRLANPLDMYSQAISKRSGKRKKTIEDIWELARIEWEGALYLEDGEIKIPMRVIKKTFERGATKQKNGTLWKSGAIVLDDSCSLSYAGKKIKVSEGEEIPNPELDPFFKNNMFQAIVKIGQASLLRTRAIFRDWSLETTIAFDPTVINHGSIMQAASDAGRLVGMGTWRIEKGGGFGRFEVEEVK